MQKKVTLITIILVSVLLLAVAVGAYLLANSSFGGKSNEAASNIQTAQSELDKLKAEKDTNGFTPTEVVKAFFGEVKSDSTERAKLYLAPETQAMDIKATLKLGSDLANISTGDNIEETDGDNINVSMTFILATDDTTVRVFTLSKYDGVWKITGVTAE